MKSLFTLILIFVFSSSIQAQSLMKGDLFNSEDRITYSIATLCDNAEVKQAFESQFLENLKGKPADFIFTTDHEPEPDIIVSLVQQPDKPATINAMISTLANHSLTLRGDLN